MLNHLDFFTSRLGFPLSSANVTVKLRNTYDALKQINSLPIGDHVYFIVSYQGRREVLKYTHTQKVELRGGMIELPIERGQHGTTITSWPNGACVRTEMTVKIMAEWLKENCNCGDAR